MGRRPVHLLALSFFGVGGSSLKRYSGRCATLAWAAVA